MKLRPAFFFVAALAVMALPFPALAQNPVAPAEFARAADDNEVVCKRQKNIATRFETKVCKTRAQWNAIREQHMRDMKEATSPGIQLDSANPSVPN